MLVEEFAYNLASNKVVQGFKILLCSDIIRGILGSLVWQQYIRHIGVQETLVYMETSYSAIAKMQAK